MNIVKMVATNAHVLCLYAGDGIAPLFDVVCLMSPGLYIH